MVRGSHVLSASITYLKKSSRENYLAYKKIKNKCNTLIRIFKIQNINKDTSTTRRRFGNYIKPFITNKNAIVNGNIII